MNMYLYIRGAPEPIFKVLAGTGKKFQPELI
jgi:hypothetical protein